MSEEEGKSTGGPLGVILAVVLALMIAGGGATYYFYNQYRETKKALDAAQTGGQGQVPELIEEIGKVYELPQGETPTVATIRSTENLQDNPFLSRGQIDDKLLIYTGSRLVIMYRPSTKKIVAVGTVNIQQKEEGASPAPEASPTPEPTPTPEATKQPQE